MKYIATSKADAQAAADKAHQHKIATDPFYADAVAKGHTLRWSLPLQEVDKDGRPVGDFYIPVEPPVLEAFSKTEQDNLDSEGKAEQDKLDSEGKAELAARAAARDDSLK